MTPEQEKEHNEMRAEAYMALGWVTGIAMRGASDWQTISKESAKVIRYLKHLEKDDGDTPF